MAKRMARGRTAAGVVSRARAQKGRAFGSFIGLFLTLVAAAMPETVAAPAYAHAGANGAVILWADGSLNRKAQFAAGMFVVVANWRFQRGNGFGSRSAAD